MAFGFLKLVPDPLSFDHNPIALLLHIVSKKESIDENLEETLIIITTNKGPTDNQIV